MPGMTSGRGPERFDLRCCVGASETRTGLNRFVFTQAFDYHGNVGMGGRRTREAGGWFEEEARHESVMLL